MTKGCKRVEAAGGHILHFLSLLPLRFATLHTFAHLLSYPHFPPLHTFFLFLRYHLLLPPFLILILILIQVPLPLFSP
ncbi:MAG: hypothetical protein J3Q66DRAFT_328881 [Benniella sp.]|nr:MAG: hypothetical protein J3Q66DRAFT_328881 [Benniella sp.]